MPAECGASKRYDARVNRLARVKVLLGTAGAFVIASAAAVAQCAMCKEALESGDPAAARYARGIYWSILFLGSVLFATTGGVVYLVVKHGRTGPAPPVP